MGSGGYTAAGTSAFNRVPMKAAANQQANRGLARCRAPPIYWGELCCYHFKKNPLQREILYIVWYSLWLKTSAGPPCWCFTSEQKQRPAASIGFAPPARSSPRQWTKRQGLMVWIRETPQSFHTPTQKFVRFSMNSISLFFRCSCTRNITKHPCQPESLYGFPTHSISPFFLDFLVRTAS